MAHAGEEVVFRLIQLLNFLLLLLGNFVFRIIEPVEEQKQNTGEEAHHHHRDDGIEEGMVQCVLCHIPQGMESDIIAGNDFCYRQEEKHHSAAPL